MQSTFTAQDGPLARATEAVARVRVEIDQLWHDSIVKSDEAAAQRLVEVSHLIRHAYSVLDGNHNIG